METRDTRALSSQGKALLFAGLAAFATVVAVIAALVKL